MDRIEENLHRTVVWGALAVAFRAPDDEPFRFAGDLPRAAEALGLDAAPFLRAIDDTDLREPYDGIFGHTVRGPCPAYEGEYGEPRGMRFAHEIGDVQGFYRAFGLQPSRRLAERADHVAVECEFIAFLALKEACALMAHGEDKADLCRDASSKFLRNHVGRFGRALAARVRRRSGAPFYRAAAALLDQAIVRDGTRLGVPTGPAELPLREDTGTPDDACIRCHGFEGTPR
ncbi:MAG: TorD/DmsD family molecular chaperone [Planctomycetota bacterium]|jgi:TorA maturation chaperone TorD